MQVTNPILPGFHPDPSICRAGDDYYLVTSSFEYFPCIPIFHSKDLVNWEQIGHCITKSEYISLIPGNPNSTGIYAPTIRHHNGRFYVICTNVAAGDADVQSSGNFIVSTEDPYGEWGKPIFIDCPGIDPSLFFDEDGKVYFCGANGGVYACQINPDTGELLSGQKMLWYGTGGCYPEGPHIYKRGSWYYLMIAEGGTEYGHMETIARSHAAEGPYEPYEKNPILSSRSLGKAIMGTGHADLFWDPDGNWWGVCLGFRPSGYPPKYNLGRETFLFPVSWNAEDWPVLGEDGVVPVQWESFLLLEKKTIPKDPAAVMPRGDGVFTFYEDFHKEGLSLRWMYLYHPDDASITQDAANGLRLWGRKAALSDPSASTLLAFRQEHHVCRVRLFLEFDPQTDGEEAGLSIYLNRNHHYEMALIQEDRQRWLIFRRRIGSLWKVEQKAAFAGSRIYMEAEASKELYVFRYGETEEDFIDFGKGEVSYLTTEAGGAFTGNVFAVYATGNGADCGDAAAVHWIRYTGGFVAD